MKWRVLLLIVLILVRVGVNSVNVSRTISVTRIESWRMKLVGVAAKNLPEPESALVLGVVLGYKSSLSREFYQSLVNSGTVHMIVASGYNIMVVAGLSLSLFLLFFSRRWASVLAIGVMIFYVILTGGEVSVMRAALMGSLVFVGAVLGRGAKAWWSLTLAAWLMLMVDPSIIGSISFQLSVAATFGVTVLAPYFKKRLAESGASLAGLVEKLDLTTSISALLLTWPIIWFHFGRGSLISLVSNAVILPLVPLLMAFGGLMLASGILFGPIATVISWPTYALAHLVVLLVRVFGG